jgi:hypothetical protein
MPVGGRQLRTRTKQPCPGWTYRRLLIHTPGGYRLALEGLNE